MGVWKKRGDRGDRHSKCGKGAKGCELNRGNLPPDTKRKGRIKRRGNKQKTEAIVLDICVKGRTGDWQKAALRV